ncbi:MAG: hypothetical protein WEF50_14755 [Myxococcota bacterium]
MRSKLGSVSAILGLTLGIVGCQKVSQGPGFETMPGIPPDGRIISVTRGDGEFHGVWIEAPDGTLSVVWLNAANGDIYAKPQSFPRK